MHKFLAAALLALATPVFAQGAALVAKPGQTLRDAGGNRVGVISRVDRAPDGAITSVRVIAGDKFATIPADTLSNSDKGLVTSLAKKDVARLD